MKHQGQEKSAKTSISILYPRIQGDSNEPAFSIAHKDTNRPRRWMIRLTLFRQPIPDTRLGQDIAWLGWVIAQFLAQMRDMDAQVMCVLQMASAPDLA